MFKVKQLRVHRLPLLITYLLVKALALGAKAVLVGRLWIYGMGIAGEEGVRHVMKSLLADFDILQVSVHSR